jgi:hypothetical protein
MGLQILEAAVAAVKPHRLTQMAVAEVLAS